MSVASKNPFALLDDDETVEQTSVAVAVPASAVKPNEQPKVQENRSRQTNGRAPRTPRPERTADGFEVKEGRGERRGRGEGRGEGRGRSRGGRGRGRGGFQNMDRHSNTGITDSHKQVHQGWGGDTGAAEHAAETEGAADAIKEEAAPEAAVNGQEAPVTPAGEAKPTEEAEGKPRVEEEEDNTVSYDEYLKKQKGTPGVLDNLIPKLEVRQVGEGEGYEDGVLSRGGAEVLKKEDQAFFAGKTKKDPVSKPKKEKPVMIEIDARFAPVERGGRGRGRGGERGGPRGRGEGRGRGGAGAPRGRGVSRGGAGRGVDVDDAAAFPSLTA
ncbi:hypothetical protein DACRYDRAFT_22320 [Dacryopinax primogenitus]|uniref:Hyaluronan/mRNA-binding protein domain-containing protein n=1 Tax=Dacryopinax primogenitus (strain DJM 731) TaxID=1858805 RepID=M5GCN3_DACPD|nr:uncharacterized protein DACRYDRAFT_22320 [Dacryopinax primogenitus]EJU01878.1 hypothetical protein DACRYDRAFT_22320 [Dacryopinax primogenitus]